MPELILPTVRLHASWLAAREEWPVGAHQDGTALRLASDLDLDAEAGFAAWVERLLLQADRTRPLPEGAVHATHWWIVDGEEYLGAIDLRHYVNQFLYDIGGHIGYSVRPSARGRGVATWALGAVLPQARRIGLSRALLTCDDGNEPSARTIERNGGVLEDVRKTYAHGKKRRYWIAL
ncbi:GNAT family N-acetyltransferase [Streptacidiphilus jiangxiensis]|uniref:Predicted acetyltransferase n=1 Tax=Streptacidiphilus jiangxiensis TaxID=235985 RepID=A0A1H7SGR3_STRJI|nr:GNAT family N-acetyltransferase [Streptacidiphilus jiangxiensis]SEL71810.1 Predicted acetyltransferase [Streptacidiphilus jiangxiensis]